MTWLERTHGRFHETRRLRVLGRHLLDLVPPGSSVLDVGCGDGLLTRHLEERGCGLRVHGTDVLVRRAPHVPVTPFDGSTLPWKDGAFDVVVMVDVLHHADEPEALLAEAARVARRCLVVKDHLLQGPLAHLTLTFMDRVSNLRHGVVLPHHYWTPARWEEAFARLRLRVEAWRPRLGLYPAPLRPLFERSLHFAARLGVAGPDGSSGAARPGGAGGA